MDQYTSIAQNLLTTGLRSLIFKVEGPDGLYTSTAAYSPNDTILQVLQANHWAGSLNGEVVSDDLLRDLARHPANPFKLLNNAEYEVSNFDHNIVEFGTLNGTQAVWDSLIAPHLKDFGISTDPGVVPPTPGRPDGGVLEQPTPIGTAQDPAMKLVFELQDAIRSLSGFYVENFMTGKTVPITETREWRTNVAPLLANPLMTS